ncbi:MAG: hypothetical protein ACUVX8_15005 [Candidatus Zipacnadales bacterium]
MPTATERLPFKEEVVELEASLEAIKHGGTDSAPRLQEGGLWSGNGQVFFPARGQEEAWMRIPFQVAEASRAVVILLATASYDYGVWDILLDGQEIIKARDMYNPYTKLVEINLGGRDLTVGNHTLEVRTIGKNARSQGSGVYIGVDALLLRK